MTNDIKQGCKVEFTPKGKKDKMQGIVLKLFIGTDKKEYCKIQVESKIFSKQLISVTLCN